MSDVFLAQTQENHRKALAQYYPSDTVFTAKNFEGTNLYKEIKAFSGEIKRLDDIFAYIWRGFCLLNTEDVAFVELWEQMLGIPDVFFTETTSLTLQKRIDNIVLKLSGLNAITEEDFVFLATLLGFDITIEHGIDNLYPPYNVPFIPMSNEDEARFIMIINGSGLVSTGFPPYNVPFIPQSNNSSGLIRLFESIKPSNIKIIYR